MNGWSAPDEQHFLATESGLTRFSSYYAAKEKATGSGLKSFAIYFFKDEKSFPIGAEVAPAEVVRKDGSSTCMYEMFLRKQDNYQVGRELLPHILTVHAFAEEEDHTEKRFANYYAAKAAALELPKNRSFTIWADKTIQYSNKGREEIGEETAGEEENRSFTVREMVEQKIAQAEQTVEKKKSLFSLLSFFEK